MALPDCFVLFSRCQNGDRTFCLFAVLLVLSVILVSLVVCRSRIPLSSSDTIQTSTADKACATRRHTGMTSHNPEKQRVLHNQHARSLRDKLRPWTTPVKLLIYFSVLFIALAIALSLFLTDPGEAEEDTDGREEAARSLKDVDHVIIFMQENRSWNTYFGTMAGTRGFQDPNVQVNPDGLPVWFQKVDSDQSTDTKTLLPWHLGYLGGNWSEAIQCMAAGSNGYRANQAALNYGLNNQWVTDNTPWSWGYLKRDDIPVQFALAEEWTVADMYQQSQITSTNPNRVMLVSGSINAPGSPQSPDEGGVYLDNTETPGCEKPNVNCYPLKWKTIFELYEDAGVSWQVYQGEDNFDDNPLAWFEQYQNARPGTPLADKGMAFLGLDKFYKDAAKGTLPQISFIVGPRELSEHAPYSPKDGAWLQEKVVEAVTKSPKYGKSVLMISFDESGGWGDHVPPYHSPTDTPGEWIDDYLGVFGRIFTGPGFRVPFYIISPWTRGGRVLTEHSDHTSQILFIEEWLTAKGIENIKSPEVVPWRREHMSNLVNAFDFENPNLSLPNLPKAELPHRDESGNWDGSAYCESLYPETRPPVPYDSQPDRMPTDLVEEGYKECIGTLTEGRFLVFSTTEQSRLLLHSNPDDLTTTDATNADPDSDSDPDPDLDYNSLYRNSDARWVLHYYNNNSTSSTDVNTTAINQDPPYLLSSGNRRVWLGEEGKLVPRRDAVAIDIDFVRGEGEDKGRGYYIKYHDRDDGYISVNEDGGVRVGEEKTKFKVLSVTYHD
ncbi:phospholipase C [Coccidioides immitis RS]|uniref:Phospholipase C n=1 Tax=Coccidioides immitis (strain RS) TaxID=246410 RepID=J3KH63_COCIM|nr:phospholipase C [Coccidioides immitis RS]EAS35164.3 phospholipase C [Coccidioides immitis RS]